MSAKIKNINIGLTDKQRLTIVKSLSKLLADTYTLYLKTQNYHWNVTGPQFSALHLMFEGQYNELALAIDTIAERIRALGEKAPAGYKEFSTLTVIKDGNGDLSAEKMVVDLVQDNETVVRRAREAFPSVDEVNDEVTADLLTTRMEYHEKTAWMLRSTLG